MNTNEYENNTDFVSVSFTEIWDEGIKEFEFKFLLWKVKKKIDNRYRS